MAMTDIFESFTGCRRLVAAAMLLAAASTAAVAQNVVVMVNGEPITALDVDQRAKLIQLTTQKAPSRQEVLDELIDEKLKVREARRWGIEASESEVDTAYANMGNRIRSTPEQLTQNLAKSGVNAGTVRARMRADLVWQALVRGRFQSSLQLSDKDVELALQAKSPEEKDAVAVDYVMRPILLLVPPGSPQTMYEGRRKEAEALRSRFRSCEDGIAAARTLRDTAVRDQVIRSSADLPPVLRKVLDDIPVGQLTEPEVTKLGVEMFAVCAKQDSKSDTPGKREAREAVYNQRFDQQSKRYLQQLRREALIERR